MENWRQDFPIEWEKDNAFTRREFAKFLTLTSLALFAGNLWLLLKSWLYRTPRYGEKFIADLAEVPVGGARVFHYPRPIDPCILLRLSEGTLLAYSQRCTHLSCTVYWERARNRLECPCHEGVFNLADGAVIAGPPTRPLPRIELAIRGGKVFATGVRPS